MCCPSGFAAEHSAGPSPAILNREDTLLLKTVLQDSINLLEQVGGAESLRRTQVDSWKIFSSHVIDNLSNGASQRETFF